MQLTLIEHYFEPATSEPYSCGQWDSALKATPHSPKGDVSYVGALKQTVRSDAHGFRSRSPRSLLTVLDFCRIRVNCPNAAHRNSLLDLTHPAGIHCSHLGGKYGTRGKTFYI